MDPASLAHFKPFTVMHALTVMVFFGVIALLCVAGRKARGTPRETPLRRAIGWGCLAALIANQVFWLVPPRLELATSLPLHLCDIAGVVAPLALLTDRRWLRGLLYFWGLVLSIQAFLTPVITEGPANLRYWFFFGSHAFIVGAAIYDLAAGGFFVTARDLRRSLFISYAYVAVLFLINIPTGWNYGYVGRATTGQPTVISLLGPWPWRVLLLGAVGSAAFVVAWLPFAYIERRRRLGAAGPA